jgi:hypothetical protein
MAKELTAAYDSVGCALGVSVYAITNLKVDCKVILLILNSKLIDYYYKQKFISKHLSGEYIGYNKGQLELIPIRCPQDEFTFRVLHDYIFFLRSLKSNKPQALIQELTDFLEKQIVDFIVYELYFKERFIEDSKKAIKEGKEPIYPHFEKGPFLIDLVAKYLKPIDYDSYAKLVYSIKPLTEEEKQKIEKMKEECLKTIKEVVEAIKADEEIMGLIERIKQHEWVRVIEGE